MKIFKPPYTLPIAFLLLLAAYFPIFLHLDSIPIQLWDESRLATNAVEMSQDGNFITTHFYHRPDMWNTKPPLMIWLQTLSIKALGVGELAIRLPSAMAALLTVALLFVFGLRFTGKPYLGLFAGWVLITTHQYIELHGTRTGDYDALLVLFITAYLLAYFAWTETGKTQHLIGFFVALTLAALTKGVAGLMLLPALFVYTVARRKLLPILKHPATWLGILGFALVIGGYYLLREQNNPGFLKAVYDNELGGRYLKPLEGHKGGPLYYLRLLYGLEFKYYWFYLSVAALVLVPKNLRSPMARLNLFLVIGIVSYIATISSAGTKLTWYLLPVYPLIALLVGSFWVAAMERFANPENGTSQKVYLTGTLLFLLSFAYPYFSVTAKCYGNQLPADAEENTHTAAFMSKLIKSNADLSNFYYVSNTYDPQNRFYLYMPNQQGQYIKNRYKQDAQVGDRVIVYEQAAQQYIKDKFMVDIELEEGNLAVYRLKGLKG